jgi:hypothetical protein
MKRSLAALLLSVTMSFANSLANQVVKLPLNPDEPVEVPIGTAEPTTIVFPSTISGIIPGTRMARAGAQLPLNSFHIIFDHPQNSNLLVVRGLASNAQSNITVIWRKRAYLLHLVSAATPAYLVRMEAAREDGARATRISKPLAMPKFDERIGLGLIDRARAYPFMADKIPELYKGVEAVFPKSVTNYGPVKITLRETYRFNVEDAVVFRLEITNSGPDKMYILPASLAARAGQNVYPRSVAMCPDYVPPGQTMEADFVVVGMPDGTRNDLSIKNAFTIVANIQKEPFPELVELPDELPLIPTQPLSKPNPYAK